MKKINIHLYSKRYKKKPKGSEITKISKSIINNLCDIKLDEFAHEVGEEGTPFLPAVMKGSRKNENFQSQQIFALDFDEGFTLDSFFERAEKYDIIPFLVYATYSYTKEHPRFRAVFLNDCIIEDAEAAEVLRNMLLEIFPEADSACKDAARMFFGGKEILYTDYQAEINIKSVSLGMQAYMKKRYLPNYKNKIKGFANRLNIFIKGTSLGIFDGYEENVSFDFDAETYRIIIVDAQKSKKYCLIKVIELHYTSIHSECDKKSSNFNSDDTNLRQIRNKSIDELRKACPLLDDMYQRDIGHNLRFLLATNLMYFTNGKKFFFKGIIPHREKWSRQWTQIKEYGYRPQSCTKGGCPYVDQCNCSSLYHKFKNKIIQTYEEPYFIPLPEAERQLQTELENAINSLEKKVYLIRAQTALGKTRAYCELARSETGKKLMIAVPTNNLQREVCQRLKSMGVPVYATPDLKEMLGRCELPDLLGKIQILYKTGFPNKVKETVESYIETHTDLPESVICELNAYLGANKNLNGECCVVTTHAMFFSFRQEILEKYEIIIDEDILMTIFKGTDAIPFDDIKKIINMGILSEEVVRDLNEIMDLPDGSVQRTSLPRLSYSEMEKLYERHSGIRSSFPDFMASNSIHIDSVNKKIDFIRLKYVPDVKITVVSATANKKLYADFFHDREVRSVSIPSVKYKGSLRQYTAHTMSRACIDKTGTERVIQAVQQIVGGDAHVLTFKKYDETKKMYFGKCEGLNDYEGKNMAVIGTPHIVPFIYDLIGNSLGYKTGETLANRNVHHNGYCFPMMTFSSVDMQSLQLYFLESELEQAIGRARLLRYDCTVWLFSNFPLKQAKLIQEDYLLEESLEKVVG